MARTRVEHEYFEWMFDLVCEGRFSDKYSYRKLLRYLHDVEFAYKFSKDANRAEDGIDLRYRFAYDTGCACADGYLEGPCSVLEMMIALAIKCEDIMDDTAYGDRTAQWFWRMITSLGLNGMNDDRFDEYYVKDIIDNFLKRRYESDGRGGLFTIRNCDEDLRHVEIYTQMKWFINSII